MPDQNRIVKPLCAMPRGQYGSLTKVRMLEGYVLPVPEGWELLPPGDAALTRRVKLAGPSWVMEDQKGRRTFSLGVWAPSDRIQSIREGLVQERNDPAYQKRLIASRKRREKQEESYGEDFRQAVVEYLRFHASHRKLAEQLSVAITAHATPVGSGTVARTKRIPIEERAEAAVIAWMRHHTTNYDRMHIPRVKGKRRAVRRKLAQQSIALLNRYRQAENVPTPCTLSHALNGGNAEANANTKAPKHHEERV